jgi:L-alanine-DL-glutamate epimerase-like enolase superfamily enzyme
MPALSISRETWPIRGRFTISRGSRTAIEVVVVELEAEGRKGRGEGVPYSRYGESLEGVIATLEGVREEVEVGLDRWMLAGLPEPGPLTTAYTLSLDSVENMRAAAAANAERPLLKLKLAGPEDLARVEAVREGAPQASLVVDANEGWSPGFYGEIAPQLEALGVAMIEQPLHAENDGPLAWMKRPIPVCADESCHDRASLPALAGRYDMINIKLDKTGGLTEALKLKTAAEAAGFQIMVGCMLGTSLAMAPASLVGQGAAVVDLDGPLLLQEDRPDGLRFEGSILYPPEPALWG